MTTLRDALILIDELYNLPETGENVPWYDSVINDHIGGVDTGWAMGSVFADEGRLLYGLLRAIRPAVVFEVGCANGCSSSHMLDALHANGKGKLISADLYKHAGAKITPELAERHVIFRQDAQEIFAQVGQMVTWPDGRRRKLPRPDFIFDDGGHKTEQVATIAALAREHLKPGGFMLWHDAMHPVIGEQVRSGIKAGGITGARFLLLDGTDTGVGVWQRGG